METKTSDQNSCLARAIDHARQGHSHAQQVITFVDTKSGILLTYSFAVVAAPLWLAQSACGGAPDWTKLSCIFQDNPWTCGFGLVSLLAWFACVTCCLESVGPRKPLKTQRLMLFPYFPQSAASGYEKEYQNQMQSFDTETEVNEYSSQLAVLGAICERKVFWHRLACAAFRWQLVIPGLIHSGIVAFLWFQKRLTKKNMAI